MIAARLAGRRPALLVAGGIAVALLCVAVATGAGRGHEARSPRVLQVSVPGSGRVADVATGVAAGDGRVLTVAHVIPAGRHVTVDGRPATVVRVDRRADLALLSVPGLHAPGLRLGDGAGTVAVGVRVLREGHARLLPGTVRRRVVARVRAAPTDAPQVRPGLELGVGVSPGDSGAPVLDAAGRLLGVVFARAHDRGDTSWAVDATAVRALLAG